MKLSLGLVGVMVMGFAIGCTQPQPTKPTNPELAPLAHTVDTVEHVFGIDVVDPYRWMETATEERDEWLRGQSASALEVLAGMPDHGLAARANQLGNGAMTSVALLSHGRLMFMLGATLATRDPSGADRALAVPTQGARITDFRMSRDGSMACYALAQDGVEALHVVEVATGNQLPDVVPDVRGTCNWVDSTRFYYRKDGVVRVHIVGQSTDQDVTILDRTTKSPLAVHPDENAWVFPLEHSSRAMATIAAAGHADVRIALSPINPLDRDAKWQTLTNYGDGVIDGFVHGDRMYYVTVKDELVSVPVADPDLAHARIEIAADPEAVLGDIGAAADAVYFIRRAHRQTRLMRWPWSGAATAIAVPDGWISDLTPDTDAQGLVFRIDSWLRPSAYYVYDPVAVKVASVNVHQIVSTRADTSDMAVDDVEVRNGDVTVPLTIIHQRTAKLDGSHPTIVYVHGAFGYIERPWFLGTWLAWLEHGGVLAFAHVRGDGDKGARWHDAGRREHKLDGVGDLIACADYLVARHWTASSRLGLGANGTGGIVAGRAVTLRPELFAAVAIARGRLDPARIANDNDALELGEASTEAGFKSLFAMDPYLHIAPRTPYPAVLLTTSLDDKDIQPWHTAKFAARLLAASTSGRPILVYVETHDRSRDLAWDFTTWRFMLSQFH